MALFKYRTPGRYPRLVSAREARITASFADLPVTGVSVAGRETWFLFPTLGIAYDLGRAPYDLVPIPNVFLSHAHLDHASGLAWWVSQRRLARLPGGVVRTEPATVPGWREILAVHERLEGVTYDARVEGIAPGETVAVRRDLDVSAFRVDHRVPTLGFLASERRHRSAPEFRGRSEEEIRAAHAAGAVVNETVLTPLVAFCGDTASGVFDLAPPEVFRAKVLLLECSFVEERDRGRGKAYSHLHVDEIAERADLFENEALVLTHLSLRSSAATIRHEIRRALPARLAARTVPFLPE